MTAVTQMFPKNPTMAARARTTGIRTAEMTPVMRLNTSPSLPTVSRNCSFSLHTFWNSGMRTGSSIITSMPMGPVRNPSPRASRGSNLVTLPRTGPSLEKIAPIFPNLPNLAALSPSPAAAGTLGLGFPVLPPMPRSSMP